MLQVKYFEFSRYSEIPSVIIRIFEKLTIAILAPHGALAPMTWLRGWTKCHQNPMVTGDSNETFSSLQTEKPQYRVGEV